MTTTTNDARTYREAVAMLLAECLRKGLACHDVDEDESFVTSFGNWVLVDHNDNHYADVLKCGEVLIHQQCDE